MKRGFTLVELIVSLLIFSVLLSGIFYALSTELRFWQRVVTVAEKQQIANAVLARMIRDIRGAKEIAPGSNNNKLILKTGSEQIEYSFSAGKVKRKKNNYSSYLTTKGDIQSLAFSYPASKLVEVQLGSNKTKAALRN